MDWHEFWALFASGLCLLACSFFYQLMTTMRDIKNYMRSNDAHKANESKHLLKQERRIDIHDQLWGSRLKINVSTNHLINDPPALDRILNMPQRRKDDT